METKNSHHYGPAKKAFAADAARQQKRDSATAMSPADSPRYDNIDDSDSTVDAFAAFMLVLCIAGAMLLWVSTR